jgi:LPS sulfotransferase NodH
VAGRPEEYFEARRDTGLPPHPGDYLKDLPRTGAGIRDDLSPPEAPPHSSLLGLTSYREHLERTFRLGTTPNGVFGAKLMWSQIAELHSLAGELPEFAELEPFELLEQLFAGPRYVRVTRRDKVRQAVSLWRALQTRSWREHAPGDTQPVELHYRFEGLQHLVRSLEAEDAAWGEFFSAHDAPVLTIVYEDDLERDRDRSVRAVLNQIGVDAPAARRAVEVPGRQADSLSDDWTAAYHRDAAQRGLGAAAAAPAR